MNGFLLKTDRALKIYTLEAFNNLINLQMKSGKIVKNDQIFNEIIKAVSPLVNVNDLFVA